MNIGRFLPGLASANTEETPFEDLTPEEQAEIRAEEKRRARDAAPKHGPANLRYIGTGQQRRTAARARRSQARKATKRHRKEFFRTDLALAVLRGQLQAVGRLRYSDGTVVAEASPAIERALIDTYGSVDAAYERYQSYAKTSA